MYDYTRDKSNDLLRIESTTSSGIRDNTTYSSNTGSEVNIRWDNYTQPSTIVSNAVGSTETMAEGMKNYVVNSIKNSKAPNNIGKGQWIKNVGKEAIETSKQMDGFVKVAKVAPYALLVYDTGKNAKENYDNRDYDRMASDAIVDTGMGLGGMWASTASGAAWGSICPGAGNLAGAAVGFAGGAIYYFGTEVVIINDKSLKDHTKDIMNNGINILIENHVVSLNSAPIF